MHRSSLRVIAAATITAAVGILAPAQGQEFRAPMRGLILIGDTQGTLAVESHVLRRESNESERSLLMARMAEMNPDGVVILGDLVTFGSSERDWRIFDEVLLPLKKREIPVLPVLGNHDYMGRNRAALSNFVARFPQFSVSRWFAREHGKTGLIFLDSNRDDLGPEAWSRQKHWFESTLEAFERNPAIRIVLCLSHHPPYTNSKVTGDEAHVQEAFLPAFSRSRKAKAWIAGHVHAYERFEKGEKTYLVSGGGGGPRVELKTGAAARHTDLYPGGSPRPFHFIHVDQGPPGKGHGTLRFTVHGMEKGSRETRILERFDLTTE